MSRRKRPPKPAKPPCSSPSKSSAAPASDPASSPSRPSPPVALRYVAPPPGVLAKVALAGASALLIVWLGVLVTLALIS